MALREELAAAIGVAPGSINGFVLGEHGDSKVVAFSSLQIGGDSLGWASCRSDDMRPPVSRARTKEDVG